MTSHQGGLSQVSTSGFTFKRLDRYDRVAAHHSSTPSGRSGGINSRSPATTKGGNDYTTSSGLLLGHGQQKPPSTVFSVDAAVETEGASGVGQPDEKDLFAALQHLSLANSSSQRHQRGVDNSDPSASQHMRHPLLVKTRSEFTPVALSALLRHSAVEQLDRRVQRLDHIEKVTEGMSPTGAASAVAGHRSSSGGRRRSSPRAQRSTPPRSRFFAAAAEGSDSPLVSGTAFGGPSPVARPPVVVEERDVNEEVPVAALRFHQLREEYLSIRRMFRDSEVRRSVSPAAAAAAASADSKSSAATKNEDDDHDEAKREGTVHVGEDRKSSATNPAVTSSPPPPAASTVQVSPIAATSSPGRVGGWKRK